MSKTPLLSMLPLQENIQCHSWSLGKVLNHLKLEYGNPPVMIHEMVGPNSAWEMFLIP